MGVKVTNNAVTTLAAGITNIATTLTVAPGTGALFPALAAGDWFWLTLLNAAGATEITKCTARATDALTITRAQDGTTAATWLSGDVVGLFPTAALMNDAMSALTVASNIHAAPAKSAPVGLDEFSFWDSVGSVLNKVTYTNLLATLLAALKTAGGTWVHTLTGDVTGNLTGNVTGNVTGNADTATKAGIPQSSASVGYTTVLADANKHVLHPAADNVARVITIDSNANVAYPLGTTLTFVNEINTVTIAIASDTLMWAGVGTIGSRTLAATGMATAIKITTTKWMISGSGLT